MTTDFNRPDAAPAMSPTPTRKRRRHAARRARLVTGIGSVAAMSAMVSTMAITRAPTTHAVATNSANAVAAQSTPPAAASAAGTATTTPAAVAATPAQSVNTTSKGS